MLEILFFTLIGVLTGVLTGLLPGLHPNTVIFISIPFYFDINLDFVFYGSFIAGVSISHTFHDFIPSIFLGVPDPASALAALPGQKMALRGEGREAFAYTVYGGAYSVLAAAPIGVLLYYGIEHLYRFFQPFMEYVLLFILLLTVFKSDTELKAGVVAGLSGVLGILVFEAPVNQQYALLPVFAGLFAMPSLFQGIRRGEDIPEQRRSPPVSRESSRGGFIGLLASIPIILFPGLSSSISTTFLMPFMRSRKQFLAATGAVNTSDILLSFITLMAMGSARSGASVAMQSLGNREAVWLLIGVSFLAVALSVPLALRTVDLVLEAGLVRFQSYVSAAIMVFILLATAYLTSWLGVLILLTSTCIGFMASLSSDRHSCMAVLIVPSITYFLGSGMFM